MLLDKPTDQLVFDELFAHLNLHTARLRRATIGISAIAEAVAQQTDELPALLRGQAEIKAEQMAIHARLDQIESVLAAILKAVQKPSGN